MPSISRNSVIEKCPRILRASGYDSPAESVNRAGQDVQFSRHEVNRRPIRRCLAGKANRERIRTVMTMSGTRISGSGYSRAVRFPSGGTNKPTDATQLRGAGTEGTDINGFARTKLRNGRNSLLLSRRGCRLNRDEVDRRSLETELL